MIQYMQCPWKEAAVDMIQMAEVAQSHIKTTIINMLHILSNAEENINVMKVKTEDRKQNIQFNCYAFNN